MPIVRDIMTVDIKTAKSNTTLEEVASMMRDEDVGAIPILKEEELVGIVNGRDIVIRCIVEGNDPAEMTADAIVTEELETIDPDADVQEAARIMAERQVRRLPVVEDGRLAGMISLGGVAVKHADGARQRRGPEKHFRGGKARSRHHSEENAGVHRARAQGSTCARRADRVGEQSSMWVLAAVL